MPQKNSREHRWLFPSGAFVTSPGLPQAERAALFALWSGSPTKMLTGKNWGMTEDEVWALLQNQRTYVEKLYRLDRMITATA